LQVPAALGEDRVEQVALVLGHAVADPETLGEVAIEHLVVSGLVHHLGGLEELVIGALDDVDELAARQHRALLAVHEGGQPPGGAGAFRSRAAWPWRRRGAAISAAAPSRSSSRTSASGRRRPSTPPPPAPSAPRAAARGSGTPSRTAAISSTWPRPCPRPGGRPSTRSRTSCSARKRWVSAVWSCTPARTWA